MSKIITTADLIQKTAELFNQNGYFNTSIADVGGHCGLKKASVYHHVNSKKELGIRTLEFYHAQFKEKVLAVAKSSADKKEALKKFIQAICDFYASSKGGCLMGNFSLEASALDDDLHQLCLNFFKDFQAAFQALLGDSVDAKQVAHDAVALIQGTVMSAQVQRDPAAIHFMKERLGRMLVV